MAQDLRFTIRVDDQGTAVVENFTDNVEDSAKKAKRSAAKMTKAFAGVRKGIGRVSKAVFSLRGFLVGLGAAAIIRSVARAAFAQEEAVTRLNASLRASGEFTEEASRSLQEFASQMQATTIFGDEVILNQIALAQAFGFTTENVKEAVAAAVELSAAAGIELTEAVRRLGRSISGSVEDIAKFAPEIRNLTKEQLAAGDAAKVLGDALRGSAAAQAETARGRMIQFGNALGDVAEKIGQSVTSSDKFLAALKGLTAGISEANNSISGSGQLGDALAELVPTTEATVAAMQSLSEFILGITLAFTEFAFVVRGAAGAIETFGNAIDFGVSTLFGFDEEAQVAVERQQKLSDEFAKGIQNIDRQFTALERLTTAHEDAAKAVRGQADAQKALGRETAAATKQTKASEEASRELEDRFARLKEIGPVALAVISKESRALAERIAELPPIFDKQAEALFNLLGGFGGLTREIVNQVGAELAVLESDFLRKSLAIQAALATSLQATQEGITSFFAFSNQETSAQFQALISTNQQAFAQINTLTAQAADFGKQSALDKASAIVGITGAFFGTLLALTSEGSRREFEFFKGFAIAEALVAAGLAITKAFTAGPIFGPILAATIAGQTALQIRQIKSVQFGGGGGGGAVGGGGGGGGPVGGGAAAAPAPAVEAAPVAAGQQITISVSGFIGDEAALASALGEIISEAQGDDVEFQLS